MNAFSSDTFRGVFIGAGITLLGVLCTQLVSVCLHYLDTKRERTKLLREKCEQISDHFCESGLWWGKIGTCYTLSELRSFPPPLNVTKAAMLSIMYFRTLETPLIEYYKSLLDFYHFLVDHAPAGAGPSAIVSTIIKSAEFKKHNDRIDLAKIKVQNALAAQAKKLLRA